MSGPQKFFDQSQPQTLQVATFLLYLDAVLLVISGGVLSGFGLILAGACGGGAYGMANTRKWGYGLAVGAAIVQLVLPVLLVGPFDFLRYSTVTAMFAIALVCLLLHPQSRDYQRIWFS